MLIADTWLKRAAGLMGHRASQGAREASQGMLFIYDKPDFHSIWTVGMKFAIDIIWLDVDKSVVDYHLNARAGSFDQLVPKREAKYVLELASNLISRMPNRVEFA